MPQRRTLGLALVVALIGIGLVGAGAARAFFEPRPMQVLVRDDCEVTSFNAAIGPGTCIGPGQTTFGSFIGQLLATGQANKWDFVPDNITLQPRQRLAAVNIGGEFHTFSQVAAFGGGCIDVLNDLLGLTPVPECQPEVAPGVPLAFVTTGIEAGDTLLVPGVASGVRRFECLIHPWMRTTVHIRGGR
jgi:hypothetical protein